MHRRLDARAPGFAAEFDRLVEAARDTDAQVSDVVAQVIAEVAKNGDTAVATLTQRFDRIDLAERGFEIGAAEIDAACANVSPELMAALELAATRIRAFHEKQRPADHDGTDAAGVRAGYRWTPVDSVGLYVPGGLASYPSSVLMNAIPAKVAGARRLVMVTPTPDGRLNPLVLAAAKLAGVDVIYRIGGAQAVAALAFGTATIPAVDKIVGPGNAYVAEAKRQLYGRVGIDMVAGPSEILVVADGANDPAWIAADLLSQAEHDPAAQVILITDDAAFVDAVAVAVDALIEKLPTGATARQSWDSQGAIILVEQLLDAVPLVDRLAPEHLELAVADPQPLFDAVRHAGSIFIGRHTPEAVGDYVGGPNHVLPTGRRARFASGLSVTDFMKRTTFLECSAAALAAIGPAAQTLAEAEGLIAHAESVRVRLNS
ncbi:histidinol dehydrogenase [Sphingoaurantiacus capsulatus]|uniref:Histidinol dehydrogenase n=1 Tax=Sphingoaurantiacus capsulatus TaxID=1771310 RepID=A0ABV7XDJ0_9SPHN